MEAEAMEAQKPRGTTLNGRPSITLRVRRFEVFGGRTHLAMPQTISARGTSSLKPGSGATEGVLDYGVLGRPAYVMWAGLLGHEDTR